MTIELSLLLALNVLIGLAGQVLMKNAIGDHPVCTTDLFSIVPRLFTDWRLITAVLCYFLNLLLYLVLLSRIEMGFIFTLQVSLGIIAVTITGILFYREQLNFAISLGIILIIIGIFLISLR